jgi:hypothetical protein
MTTDGTFGTARALSVVTAAVAVTAGVWTFANPGLLHGPPAMQGSARGTALVLLTVAVPVLLASVWAASRGRGWALLTTAGALLYVVYNAVLLLFLTPFNAAFLVYVALLGFSLWSLGYLLAARKVWQVGETIAAWAPVRPVAVYVWVVAGLNAAAWLGVVVPSLRPYPTPMLQGTGVETNAIYVQDLAVWLPLAAVAAFWLWRRQARGAVVSAAMLGLWVIEGVSVAVDQWFGSHADPTSSVVSLTMVGPFLALAAVGLVPLWLLLRSAAPSPGDPAGERAALPRADAVSAPARPATERRHPVP